MTGKISSNLSKCDSVNEGNAADRDRVVSNIQHDGCYCPQSMDTTDVFFLDLEELLPASLQGTDHLESFELI